METAESRYKHRAAEPMPVAARPTATRAHRASRAPENAITVFLGTLLIVLLVILATRG